MLEATGLALAFLMLVAALAKSRRPAENDYAGGVYGLTAREHRRYAALAALLGALFIAGMFFPAIPTAALLAVMVLVAVFYFTSFLRGFSDEE